MKHTSLGLSLAAALVLTGCLERQFAESQSSLSVDSREILVPSDKFEGRDLVKDTLYVTANRNWTIELEDGVDWVTVDTTGLQVLSKVSEKHPVEFSFKDNETDNERSAKVTIWSDGNSKTVTLRQEAIDYRLVLTSSKDGFGAVKSDGDVFDITFNTNTEWTASVMEGGEVKISFSSTSGKYSDSIKAIIAENEDLITKSSVIVISAKNCKDIEIPVGQLEGFPYFRLGQAVSPYISENNEMQPGIGGYKIPIETNVSWKAEIVELVGFKASDVSIQSSGSKAEKSPTLSFPYCVDFDNPVGKITVRFKAEGVAEPIDFTLTQKPCIRIRWFDETAKSMTGATSSGYPFSSPLLTFLVTSKGKADGAYLNRAKTLDMVLNDSGIVFTAASTKSFWRNGATGLMFGEGIGDWLELPAVEGHRLARVHYRWGGKDEAGTSTTSHAFSLRDAAGGIVAEASYGETVTLQSPSRNAVSVDLVYPGTEAGVKYRMVLESASNFNLGDLTLYYE